MPTAAMPRFWLRDGHRNRTWHASSSILGGSERAARETRNSLDTDPQDFNFPASHQGLVIDETTARQRLLGLNARMQVVLGCTS